MALVRFSENFPNDLIRVHRVWDDFIDEYALTSNEPVTGTSPWIGTALTGGTTTFATDAAGGVCVLSGAATTDNTGSQIQWDVETFALQASKDVVFACRFKLSDVTQSHFFCGLGVTDTTFLDGADGNACLAHTDSIGFFKADGAATLAFVGVTGSAVTVTSTVATLTADTYVYVEFLYKASGTAGSGTVLLYVNGLCVGQVTTASFPTTELTPTLSVVSGSATGTVTATSDYIGAAMER